MDKETGTRRVPVLCQSSVFASKSAAEIDGGFSRGLTNAPPEHWLRLRRRPVRIPVTKEKAPRWGAFRVSSHQYRENCSQVTRFEGLNVSLYSTQYVASFQSKKCYNLYVEVGGTYLALCTDLRGCVLCVIPLKSQLVFCVQFFICSPCPDAFLSDVR